MFRFTLSVLFLVASIIGVFAIPFIGHYLPVAAMGFLLFRYMKEDYKRLRGGDQKRLYNSEADVYLD